MFKMKKQKSGFSSGFFFPSIIQNKQLPYCIYGTDAKLK